MTTVTSFTAARMQAIEDETIVDAALDGDDLILTTREGTDINVGSVRGPTGATGATGPAGAGVAVGMLADFPKLPLPAGWLHANGEIRSIVPEEADLAAYLGTTYGGNGTTTYGLPSFAGRVRVGIDAGQTEFDTVGEIGGAKTHTLTTSEMPVHTHPDTLAAPAHTHPMPHTHTPSGGGNFLDDTSGAPVAGTSGGIGGGLSATTSQPSSSSTGAASATALTGSISNAGSGAAHNNLQPYRVVYVGIYAGPDA